MLQRFDTNFLRDFRAPIAIPAAALPLEAAAPPPPPPPTFSEEELESSRLAAKKLGYAEGFEAGLAQASTEAAAREKDTLAAMSHIKDKLSEVATTYAALINEQSTELADLVVAIARKVAGEALDARGVDTIVALVLRCLPVFLDKPKVVVEVHSDMLDNVKEVLRPYLDAQGFAGDLQFKSNDTLDRYDARVEWANGHAHRSTEHIWREIEALLLQMPLTPQLPNTNPPHTP